MTLDYEDDGNTVDDRVQTLTALGTTFTVTRSDPYGFCRIEWDKTDKLPVSLTGDYTTFSYALHDIEVYVEQMKKDLPAKKKSLEMKLA